MSWQYRWIRRRGSVAAVSVLVGLGYGATAHGADWITMVGTEPADATHRIFGMAWLTYADNSGCDAYSGIRNPGGPPPGPTVSNGFYHQACVNAPEFKDTASLMVDNLVLGARGNLIPERINYLVAVNAGENFYNYDPFDTSRRTLLSIQDASVTFSYIPGVRVRAGLLRKPGPEEAMRPAAPDFIFPSVALNQLHNEVFLKGNAYSRTGAPIPGQGFAGNISPHGYDADMGRDWGIQGFDAFKLDKWTLTYALMVGNGNGIHQSDNNSAKDVNAAVSAEYDLPGGKGPGKHGIKVFGYWQQGERNFEIDAAGTESKDFDRIRYGFGARALGEIFGAGAGRHRLGADAYFAEGMIFYAPVQNVVEGPFRNGVLGIAAEGGNKARGFNVEYGYYLGDKWQFDLRWGLYQGLYETEGPTWVAADERRIDDWTFGVSYAFTPMLKLAFNYQMRDYQAPNAVKPVANTAAAINSAAIQTANQNIVTDSVGDRFGVRLTYAF